MNAPQDLLSALQELRQGKPFPWAWLATQEAHRGAQVRTIRLLAYNWVQGTLTFASHADHGKLQQIQADPRGQLCLLREQPLIQIRLDLQLSALPSSEHPQGERFWQKLSPNDKLRLYQVHPQRPTPPAGFWLVDGHIKAAEVLRLGDESSRLRYLKNDQDWTCQSLPL